MTTEKAYIFRNKGIAPAHPPSFSDSEEEFLENIEYSFTESSDEDSKGEPKQRPRDLDHFPPTPEQAGAIKRALQDTNLTDPPSLNRIFYLLINTVLEDTTDLTLRHLLIFYVPQMRKLQNDIENSSMYKRLAKSQNPYAYFFQIILYVADPHHCTRMWTLQNIACLFRTLYVNPEVVNHDTAVVPRLRQLIPVNRLKRYAAICLYTTGSIRRVEQLLAHATVDCPLGASLLEEIQIRHRQGSPSSQTDLTANESNPNRMAFAWWSANKVFRRMGNYGNGPDICRLCPRTNADSYCARCRIACYCGEECRDDHVRHHSRQECKVLQECYHIFFHHPVYE